MRRLFSVPLGTYVPGGIMFKCWDPSGVIAAGINLAGNVASNQINAERAASDMATYLHLVGKQRDWQKEDQQWSEDLTKRLMDYQNQYNTPSQQMKRFAGAGLNPYLALQGGELGSGNSQSVPSVSDPSRGSVSPFQRPALDNVLSDPSTKLLQGASVENERLAALSSVFKSAPELYKAVGEDRFNSIMSSLLGGSVDSQIIKDISTAEAMRANILKQRESIALEIEQMYGKDKAALINQNLIFEGQHIVAEMNKLYSEKALNEASVKELITRAAKNVAEKANLEANTATVDQMRQYVVKSANMQASIDEFDKLELETDFVQRRYARAWQRSPEGMSQATAAQVVQDNGETNLINKVIRGKEPRTRHK